MYMLVLSLPYESHIDPGLCLFSEFGYIMVESRVEPQLQALSALWKCLQLCAGECGAEPWLLTKEQCCLLSMFGNPGV